MSAPSEGAYMRCRTPQAGRISRAAPSRRRIHSAVQRSYFVRLTAYHLDALGLDLSPSSAYVIFLSSRLCDPHLPMLFLVLFVLSSAPYILISRSPHQHLPRFRLRERYRPSPAQPSTPQGPGRLRSPWAIITLYNVNCRSSSRWLHSSVTLYPTIDIERKSTHS